MFALKKLFLFGANETLCKFIEKHVVNCSMMIKPIGSLTNQHIFVNQGILARSFASKQMTNIDKLGQLLRLKPLKYDLHFDETKSRRPVIILHGLLGCKENWDGVGRQLNRKLGRTVWAVDFRNHGASPYSIHFNYEYLVCDLISFMRTQGIYRATLIGHNMGGRVGMMLAMRYPNFVQSLVVVETSPVSVNADWLGVKQLLRDIKNLYLDRHYTLKEARKQAAIQLKEKKYNEKVIEFLLSNMVENEWRTNWCWKFNLESIMKTFEKEILYFPIVNSPCYTRTLFLGGTNSDYLIRQEEPAIKKLFPLAEFAYIEGASHWVHVDKPVEFLDTVTDFLNKDPTKLQEDAEMYPVGQPVALESQKYDEKIDENKSPVPVIILHGLLGSKQNWNSMAGQINRKVGRTVWTVDARNHGESPHTELFTYELMVCDLIVLMRDNHIPKATLIGHSMGGRTAMMLAMMYPQLVESLVVVDISPGGASPNMLNIKELLNVVKGVQLNPESTFAEARKQAATQLKEKIKDEVLVAFLLTNLVPNTNRNIRSNWRWKFNVDSILKNVDKEIFNFPIVNLPCQIRTLFIAGCNSDYLKPQDEEGIKKLFPKAEFIYIQGAGHWVHADKPYDFLAVVSDFLDKDPKE